MLDEEYRGGLVTLMANPANIALAVADCDLLIGAVLVPNAKAPTVVTKEMVKTMRPGSVIVDIAIDQGGCIETIRPTSHLEPTYAKYGVLHYAVPNMPALVGRTSTVSLTQATEPYLVQMVSEGITTALENHPGLAKGINTRNGRVENAQVAQALGYS
jgi:alanine dehydrogenase